MSKILLAAALVVLPGAALGEPGARPRAAGDPNEMLCRTVRETGSRLAMNRVCMTRAQWEQQRRDARQNTDRAQTSRVHPGN